MGKGRWISLPDLLNQIPPHVALVQITGGEPLLQKKSIIRLTQALTAAAPAALMPKKVLLETGGHRSLADLPAQIHIVMDIKLPASGEARHDFAANFPYLKRSDEIKFVVQNKSDFAKAAEWVREYKLDEVCNLLFAAVWGRLSLAELARWVLDARLPHARVQTQLHKLIWGAQAQRV